MSSKQPEINLFTEVVGQALRDLKSTPGKPRYREARCFLTNATGPWARTRAEVCLIIGVNPDELRKWVLKALEDGYADQSN